MSEAWMEVKGLRTLQRHRILKVVWYGQGWHRFKVIFRFGKVGMISPSLLAKIRSRYWPCQILDASEVGFSAISAVCFVADAVLRGLLHLRLSAPFL